MTSLYTTKRILEDICLKKQNQPWLDIIIKLKEVYINDINVFEANINPEDDPFFTLDQMQVDINTNKADFINSISSNPASVLQKPNSIYLLEIPIEKAEAIQVNYGVICQSVSNMDYTPLTQKHVPSELLEGESNYSWKKIISKFKKLPSNSLLVIDAHLFDNDKFDEKQDCYDSKYRDGINNLYEILDSTLPTDFSDTYHIGVLVTDTDKAKLARKSRTNLTNKRIASAINKLKKKLNRNYAISTEILFFDFSDNDGHKLIHNRRIISNYFIVTADYKLATLKEGRSLCTQTVSTYPLFENIDTDSETDKKEKRIRYEIKKFQDFIDRQKNSKDLTALLYQNGKEYIDFSVLNHRILKR